MEIDGAKPSEGSNLKTIAFEYAIKMMCAVQMTRYRVYSFVLKLIFWRPDFYCRFRQMILSTWPQFLTAKVIQRWNFGMTPQG